MKRLPGWLLALTADLGLGLSLGLYYTITYYGRALLPLPGFVALGAPFMYYVAVDEQCNTVIQAWLWMAIFPLTGLLWRTGLAWVPRVWGKANLEVRPTRSETDLEVRPTRCYWPLLVPIPLLMWLVGRPGGQWAWSDFIAVCLRRQNVDSPTWLTPLMMALAVLAFALELHQTWRLLPGTDRLRRAATLTVTVMLFILAVVAVGSALSALL